MEHTAIGILFFTSVKLFVISQRKYNKEPILVVFAIEFKLKACQHVKKQLDSERFTQRHIHARRPAEHFGRAVFGYGVYVARKPIIFFEQFAVRGKILFDERNALLCDAFRLRIETVAVQALYGNVLARRPNIRICPLILFVRLFGGELSSVCNRFNSPLLCFSPPSPTK